MKLLTTKQKQLATDVREHIRTLDELDRAGGGEGISVGDVEVVLTFLAREADEMLAAGAEAGAYTGPGELGDEDDEEDDDEGRALC